MLIQDARPAGLSGRFIRSTRTRLCGNKRFLAHPDLHPAAGHPLIETDPRFASYRTWLTSDYMIQALALDPAMTQKRLGDGFYEQRLISEQVAELTGRRFLVGYADEETQYQALMDAGVTYAKEWKLTPGIALTAAQMAALTTDIVWLVEKTIDLGNGRTAQALVPQLYARLKAGDLAPSGALIAANDISLNLTGDLTNSGTIAGRQLVSLTAENIRNLGGRISGQETLLAARTDLTNLGGTIEAQDRLDVSAGRDLTVQSRTVDLAYRQNGTANTVNQTVIDRVAGLYVTGANGTLVASAGRDLNLMAAAIVNAAPTAAGEAAPAVPGRTTLIAGHDLNLGTVTETGRSSTTSKKTRRTEASSTEAGSLIQTDNDLALHAGNDLVIEAGQASYDMAYNCKSSKSGFLSSSSKTQRDVVSTTTALASTFSGDNTALTAGRDLAITGSNVQATQALQLAAGRDIILESAQDTRSETHFKAEKKSGLSASAMGGLSVGKSSLTQNNAGQSVTQVASTFSGADVVLTSTRDTTLSASNVLADRDLTVLAGRNINLLAADDIPC